MSRSPETFDLLNGLIAAHLHAVANLSDSDKALGETMTIAESDSHLMNGVFTLTLFELPGHIDWADHKAALTTLVGLNDEFDRAISFHPVEGNQAQVISGLNTSGYNMTRTMLAKELRRVQAEYTAATQTDGWKPSEASSALGHRLGLLGKSHTDTNATDELQSWVDGKDYEASQAAFEALLRSLKASANPSFSALLTSELGHAVSDAGQRLATLANYASPSTLASGAQTAVSSIGQSLLRILAQGVEAVDALSSRFQAAKGEAPGSDSETDDKDKAKAA